MSLIRSSIMKGKILILYHYHFHILKITAVKKSASRVWLAVASRLRSAPAGAVDRDGKNKDQLLIIGTRLSAPHTAGSLSQRLASKFAIKSLTLNQHARYDLRQRLLSRRHL